MDFATGIVASLLVVTIALVGLIASRLSLIHI